MLLTPQEEQQRAVDIEKNRKRIEKNRNLLGFFAALAGFCLLSDVSSQVVASEKEPVKQSGNWEKTTDTLFFILKTLNVFLLARWTRQMMKTAQAIKLSQTGRQTVSDNILSSLTYGNQTDKGFSYASLTKEDLKRFCCFFDFSKISSKQQEEVLQNIINLSEKEPFLRSFIRRPLPYVFAYFDGRGVEGTAKACCLTAFERKQPVYSTCFFKENIFEQNSTFFHEIRHAQQIEEGLYSMENKRTQSVVELLKEAECIGYSALLDQYDSKETKLFNLDWVSSLLKLYIRSNMKELSADEQQQQLLGITSTGIQKKTQIETVAKVKSFNNVVGVIMRLCLEGEADERYCFLEKVLTPFKKKGLVSSQEKEALLENFEHYILPASVWRYSYLSKSSEHLDFENSPLSQQEEKVLKRYTDYYTDKTGIPLSPTDIGLSMSPEDEFIIGALQQSMKNSKETILFVSMNEKEIKTVPSIKRTRDSNSF